MISKAIRAVRQNSAAYILIAPSLIALAAILYYPMIKGVVMTFHSFGNWVGLQNYISLFSSGKFRHSLVITLIFISSTIFLQLVIGLSIALLLDKVKRMRNLATAFALAPYMVPPIAGGIIWYWVVDPSVGLINHTLQSIGFNRIYFLTAGIWPLITITIAQTWKDFGYASIIYLANLETISPQLYEAADIDGAGPMGKFRFITMPHLKTATLIILAIRTTWNIVEFALPFEMTSGGPGTRTTILSILLYKIGFVRYDLSKAYAVGVAMIAIALGAFVLYVKAFGGKGGIAEK